jgi:hypothetical protein
MLDWKHGVIAVVLFLVGFYVAKKYPSLFSSIPVVGSALG